MKQGRVGGIFFHHKSFASLNIAPNIVIMDLVVMSYTTIWLIGISTRDMYVNTMLYFFAFKAKIGS